MSRTLFQLNEIVNFLPNTKAKRSRESIEVLKLGSNILSTTTLDVFIFFAIKLSGSPVKRLTPLFFPLPGWFTFLNKAITTP